MRWLPIVILCACGGGGGSGGVSPSELPARLAESTCGKLAECCTPDELMDETLGSDNVTECRAVIAGFSGLIVDVLEDSIAAGRVVYDGEAMGACLDLLASLSCTDYNRASNDAFANSLCEDPFVGQVEVGGECANDFDCISQYCSGDSLDFDGNVMFGICIDAPIAGMPCDDGDCADGTWCDRSQEVPTCAAPKPDGAECNAFDEECQSGACIENEGGPSTCGAPTTCNGL